MKFSVSLSSVISRWGLIGLALVLFSGVVVFASLRFVTSVVANPRLQVDLSTIESAVSSFPNSAKLQARLAARLIESSSENAESHESMAERAFRHASRAVVLAPENYEYRLLLAAAAESRGEMQIAENALHEAIRLAPSDINVRWQMANLLLRLGKIDQSLSEFRLVAAADRLRLPIVMNLIWQATNGNLEMLERAIVSAPEARLELASFLVEQSQFDAATRVFGQIDRDSRLKSQASGRFFDLMLKAGQWQSAGRLWRNTVVGAEENERELLWNGSFEHQVPKWLMHFDWQLGQSKFARFQLSTVRAHSGQRSLTISYQGMDTTKLDGEVHRLVLVQPGTAYRLEFFARTEQLLTPDGPQLAILRADNREVIASSSPVPYGSNDWQMMTIDFTAPPDLQAVLVAVKQTPRYSYVEPTTGMVRFDDFNLRAQ